MEQAIPAPPIWLRILQFPLFRVVVLGAIIFYMMMINNGYLEKFNGSPGAAMAVTIIMGLLAFAVYVAWGKFIERRQVSELSLPGMGKELAAGVLIGAALMTSTTIILMILGMFRIEGMNPLSFLIPSLAMAVSAAIFEELVFRGVVMRSFEDLFGSWVGLIVSALVFGLVHLVNPAATLVSAFYVCIEAGLLLAAAYLVTRRLWISFGVHMAWNYTESAIFSGVVSGNGANTGLLKTSTQGPDLLTGGSFGLEGSVIALVMCTLGGVVMLLVAIRRGHIKPPSWKAKD